MEKYKCSKKGFLDSVKDHEIKVLKEEGVYRHLFFKSKNSGFEWFEILTWSGSLLINGDMGSFIFSRIDDMFDFFVKDKESKDIKINPSYWKQKLQGGSGHESFSDKKFRKYVKEDFYKYFKGSNKASLFHIKELWNEIEEDIFCLEDEYSMLSAINDYQFQNNTVFQDFFEHDLKEYDYRFIWCLYAIVWGIKKYYSINKIPMTISER